MRAMFVVLCTLGALAILALSGCNVVGEEDEGSYQGGLAASVVPSDDASAEPIDPGAEPQEEEGAVAPASNATGHYSHRVVMLYDEDCLDLETGTVTHIDPFSPERCLDHGDFQVPFGINQDEHAILWTNGDCSIAYDTEDLRDVTAEDLEALEFHDIALDVPMTGESIVLTSEGNYFRVAKEGDVECVSPLKCLSIHYEPIVLE